ncbi:MAG: hypothetical protein LBB67_06475 [Oscillospiraceae bacterium]|nr:hypothetical protein [Oscillospiraceae bacterium]
MKKFKRVIGLLLAVCMVFLSASVFAAGESGAQTDYPIIWMTGAFHELYLNAGTPKQTIAFGARSAAATVLKSAKTAAQASDGDDAQGDLLGYLKELNFDAVADIVADYVNQLFGPIAYDSNGNSLQELNGDINGNKKEVTLRRDEYTFDYDWREDPLISAERLHLFIQEVKRASSAEKVNLCVRSGSGTVGLAYLKEYLDEGDLAGMFFSTSLHNGSAVFGELVTKNLSIDADALANTSVLKEMSLQSGELDQIWDLLKALNDVGLLSPVMGTASVLLRAVLMDRLYEKAIIPSVLTIPVFWAYVPDEYYEKGIETCFGEDREKYAGLIAKLDNYHNNVAKNADNILKEASEVMRIGLLSAFGAPQFPLGSKSKQQGDIIIGTAYSSCGATVSNVGETLKSGLFGLAPYTQKVQDGHNHISPDNTIDASTCLLPETTWFVSGMMHFEIADSSNHNMIRWFFRAEETPTVFTDTERYPQFMWREKTIDENGKTYYADVPPPVTETRPVNEQLLSVLAKITKTVLSALFWWLK